MEQIGFFPQPVRIYPGTDTDTKQVFIALPGNLNVNAASC